MAAKLLALLSVVALATSIPTPPPDQASPVPSETSFISPTNKPEQNKTGDSIQDSKPSVEVEQFLTDMVNTMNKYRLMHAASPLVLSLNLTNKAELWAVKLANKDQEELNTNSNFGQAIFSTSNSQNVVSASVESWYNQIVHYKFDKPAANAKTNYFTQLVWKRTQEVGIGKASSASGKTYVVAYFSPAGNIGDMLNNVLPVTGSGVGKLGPANCTEDYKYYNNSCFKLFPGPRTWESAVHKCTQEFASLASIDSEAENYFIKSLLTTHKKNFTWIGLGDLDSDNTFTWVDGTSNVFTKWDYAQSNVVDKKCAVVGESFNWKYIPCSKGTSFVCRRRLRDVSIYEVVFLYLNKLWTDKLLSPEEPRYKSLKTHIENGMFDTYRDDDWFDEVEFMRFAKNEEGRILATIRLHFTPDDDSPLDPLEKLRSKLKGGNGGESTKRTLIKGVLSGEPVEIVNATLVIEHPQPVLCPGFCTVQQCPASICSQSCCNQNSLNQNPLGSSGYPGAQAQQAYQTSPYQNSPYQTSPYQTSPYQASPYQTSPYQASPYQTSPYQASPYQANPYQGYPQNSQSSFPYTGYSGPPAPQGGPRVASKPESKPEGKPDEKTKPSSSNEQDETPKEPEEPSKPQVSRPPRPTSQPLGYTPPNAAGYPGNEQTYPQQQSSYPAAYQAAYASLYPQYNPYSQTNPSVYGSPYQQPSSYGSNYPSSPYSSSYPQSYPPKYSSLYSSGYPSTHNPISEQEKPGSSKGRKGHKKRPRQSHRRPSPYPYPQPGYPSTYPTGYGYPGQTAQQGIPGYNGYGYPGQTALQGIPTYMSGANAYATNQVAGYPSTYGSSISSYGYPSTSYQGAGYAASMTGQDPYSAMACAGVCANSCAPQCSPACCRSRAFQRKPH